MMFLPCLHQRNLAQLLQGDAYVLVTCGNVSLMILFVHGLNIVAWVEYCCIVI
jgi:hypothetical protein